MFQVLHVHYKHTLKKLFKEFSMTSNESQYKLYLYKSNYAIV